MGRGPSSVWKYFKKPNENNQAQCNLCDRFLCSTNVTNLRKHIPARHRLVMNRESDSGATQNSQESESVYSSRLQTLDTIFSRASLRGRDNSINKSIMGFIIKDNLPASAVDGEGLKSLIRDFFPLHQVMSRGTVTNTIDDMYHLLKSIKVEELEQASFIALTSDLWTESYNHISYMGVTAHYLNPEGYLASACLGCEPFEMSHTAVAIAKELGSILEDWNISKEKIVCMVTDGAANMSSAVSTALGPGKHFVCFAHRLNLVAKRAVEHVYHVEQVIGKVKAIAQFSHQSNLFADALRNAQSSSEKKLKLVQSVETRWNSTYAMIERFLILFEAVTIASIRSTRSPPVSINQTERALLQEIRNLLAPLDDITRILSSESQATLSEVIPLTRGLKEDLNRVKTTSHDALIFKQALINAIEEKIGDPEKATIATLATLLDPRLKLIDFKIPNCKSHALDKLNEIVTKNPVLVMESLSQEPHQPIWPVHDNLARQANSSYDVSSSLHTSIKHYLDKPILSRTIDAIGWWNKQEDDSIKSCALKYLFIPSTSVPCERLFSKAGNIITDKRSRLFKNRLSKILYLQSLSIQELKQY
ncbi:zinc finger BED domain-containing protein 4-like [Brevipalpus obovatus]|uniref:zinc finger BED domain-containing protein 4-like n=1 Tax=Brevipalpus obovatus TaxID=246614 RepID=UPI003D9EA72D